MSTISLNNSGALVSCDSRNAKREDAPAMLSITLQSGRTIVCTPKHPIMTDDGWVEARDIKDHAIACVGRIPAPRNTQSYSFAKWIGWMLGNGSMVGYSSPSFICSCPVVAEAFLAATEALWGFKPKPHAHWCKNVQQFDITKDCVRTPEGNPVKNWLRENDLWGRRSWEKEIPSWFCETADNESLAALVSGLWETDGSVILRPRPSLSFSTTSEKMAWQLIWALTRLGIFSSFEDGQMGKKAKHKCYKVCVRRGSEIEKFQKLIPMIGRKGDRLKSIKPSIDGNTAGSRLSVSVGRHLEKIRTDNGITHAALGYRFQGKRIAQKDLIRVRDTLVSMGIVCTKINRLTNPDIYWDKVRRVRKAPGGPVFDRVVPEHHNFVANGVIVHNSGNLEQDADRVIFLHVPEQNKTTGAFQNATDGEQNELYTEAIQAKGRGEGQHKTALMFHRNTTTFKTITTK